MTIFVIKQNKNLNILTNPKNVHISDENRDKT